MRCQRGGRNPLDFLWACGTSYNLNPSASRNNRAGIYLALYSNSFVRKWLNTSPVAIKLRFSNGGLCFAVLCCTRYSTRKIPRVESRITPTRLFIWVRAVYASWYFTDMLMLQVWGMVAEGNFTGTGICKYTTGCKPTRAFVVVFCCEFSIVLCF